ncbi:hypothetical protein DLM78_12760 [Leptospira stimsonii]|uniref:Uncharacterized protein n=1 Tax=Leptospira stimsonii TaxID=2202203 RepID=A0A8B3CR43_9LEPT|nr:hypothetical protein DLM78_12760 [Leptospira stimsonii]
MNGTWIHFRGFSSFPSFPIWKEEFRTEQSFFRILQRTFSPIQDRILWETHKIRNKVFVS